MKKFTPSIVAKLTLALALLLFFTNDIRAQNPTLNDANEQLRQLFSPLSRPNPSKWFLYDMAAHVTDSIFFLSLAKHQTT